MKWLLKNFMKKDTFAYIFAVVLEISGALISHIWPLAAAGKIVDVGILQHNYPEMIRLFILSIVVFFIGRIMAYVGVIIIDSRTYNMGSRLCMAISRKLFYLDHDYFENTTVGEMNTLLTKDIKNVSRVVSYNIKQCTHEVLVDAIAILYCATINPIMAAALFAFLPVFFFVTFRYVKRSNSLYQIEREKTSYLNSYIQENIEGNRLIKNLATEEKEIQTFRTLNEDYTKYRINISYKMFNHMEMIRLLSYAMWMVMVLLGGIFIVRGNLTIGGFMIFNGYMTQITKPMYQLIEYMNDFQYFKISLKKIKTFFKVTSKQKDDGTVKLEDINTITFDHVTFETDHKQVLSDLNFQLEKNKTYAFIGEVGSGKSSIGKLILRIIDPTEGNIDFNDVESREYTISSIRDKIGYVAQTPFLFSDTIKNNVNFGNLALTDKQVKHYLKLAKADYVEQLEQGIETIIGENGISLSGGEKQRLSLARALAKEPQLLILDDITSALDYESELEITKNINQLDYECTKIIIAQKIISVKDADKIFVMKKGKIIGEGTHEELLQHCESYQEIYEIQSGNITNLECV